MKIFEDEKKRWFMMSKMIKMEWFGYFSGIFKEEYETGAPVVNHLSRIFLNNQK